MGSAVTAVASPSAETVQTRGPHLQVHSVAVYVSDQEASLRFYRDQLGFDVAFDAVLQSGERWIAVSPPDGSAYIALLTPHSEDDAARLIGRSTGIFFVTEDLITTYAEWRRRGVKFSYTPRLRRVQYQAHPARIDQDRPAWGGMFTRFRDPDGNSFLLGGIDEVTREIERQRRETAERLETQRRAAQELEIAKQVQARLFPQTLPPMATLEYAGSCIQARQVGGDYFDFLELEQGRLALIIGDVAGKGIAAALLMANLQANLRIQCGMACHHPQDLLRSVNQVFLKNTHESAYATLFYSEYEDHGRRLRFANCGHLPALLLRRDSTIERLESTATVLGMFGRWDCAIEERDLAPGDLVAAFTDGITESFSPAGEDFGEQRLAESLCRYRHRTPQEIVGAVIEEVQRFGCTEQHDDITLLVARCR